MSIYDHIKVQSKEGNPLFYTYTHTHTNHTNQMKKFITKIFNFK